MIEREEIEAALHTVFDPCSVQASAPLSVIDMGIITGIAIEPEGLVRIAVRPTSPWCTMIGGIMQGVEDQVRKVAGVHEVVVDIDRTSFDWSEADLTPRGREILEATRARSRAVVQPRRRQWQERIAAKEA